MRTFNQRLTNAYKRVIEREGLVQTGALRDSVKVYLFPKGKVMMVVIIAIDYHRYLWEGYELLERFQEDPAFGEEMSNAFEFYIEKRVEAMLNNEPFSESDLDLSIEIDLEYSFT